MDSSIPDYTKINFAVDTDKAKEYLLLLRGIAAVNGVSISALCLNFALLNSFVDKVVIGVDGIDHLENNLREIGLAEKINGIINQLDDLRIDDENILLPYNWIGARA